MLKTIELEGFAPSGTRYSGTLVRDQEPGLTIGTSGTCDWVLRDADAAPRHVEIVALGDDVWLCATAPVLLEGRMIHGWSRVYASAALVVGQCELRLEFSGHGLGHTRQHTPTSVDEYGFPPEAPTRVMNPSAPKIPSLAGKPVTPMPAAEPKGLQLDDLAERFALPPLEVATASSVKQNESFLTRRWARLSARWWMTITAAGMGLLVGFTKPTVMPARADRGNLVVSAADAPPRVITTTSVVATAEAPSDGAPPPADESEAQAREAAAALMRNEDVVAWKAYRALSASNERFAPFVHVLTKRVRRLCDEGRATPADCAELKNALR